MTERAPRPEPRRRSPMGVSPTTLQKWLRWTAADAVNRILQSQPPTVAVDRAARGGMEGLRRAAKISAQRRKP